MKKFNIQKGFLLILFLLMSIVSCKNDLDLNPISDYNAGSFYKTQSDFKLAVNGTYAQLQSLYSYNALSFDLEGRSDNINKSTVYDPGFLNSFVDDATTASYESIWGILYAIVNQSNAIIEKIDAGTFTDAAYKSYYKGEAYFLRGYAYFQLGWLYGGVPLIDKQMTATQVRTVARSTQDETLAFAAKDLTQATSLLPTVWPNASELGKATKYSAEGILARMYMFQKKYSSAKPLLTDIIGSQKYVMATNYADCFLDKYDNSAEQVFQIQYKSGDVGQGNILPVVSVPEDIASSMFPQGGGSPFLHVSLDSYNAYETGDIRRDFSIQKGYTSKSGTVDKVTCFYIKYGHGTIPSTKDDYEVNLPILRYTDVRMMYAEVLNEDGYVADGDAFKILNDVRNRAGLRSLTSTDLPNQDAFRTAMFKERRVEFAEEFLRWFDLARSGKAQTIMNAFLNTAEEGNGMYQMKATQLIFPIPNYELQINKDRKIMWQNPGY